MLFGYYDEILTSDPEVVEGRNKGYEVYFDELINFVGETFFVRSLVFEIIEIIG